MVVGFYAPFHGSRLLLSSVFQLMWSALDLRKTIERMCKWVLETLRDVVDVGLTRHGLGRWWTRQLGLSRPSSLHHLSYPS